MNARRGDIVLVDFPYSNHTGSKVRPALVVQSDVWNRKSASETALLSEHALAEDWMRPEEDEAWSHLQPER
ncbi:MAG: type II toxin-antitoxin system PemK/MazF family toxin [Blastocatellia bacterium]|nr:type II toxin-antitoxin system PemK/MazF family toxin [Blastocatellia bacterium]